MWATDQKGFICMQLATLLEQGDCVTGLWRTRCTFMCTKLNAKVAITVVYSEPQHYFSSPTLCCNTNTLSATYICFIFSAPCENNRNKYIFYTAVLLRAGALSFFLETLEISFFWFLFPSKKEGGGTQQTSGYFAQESLCTAQSVPQTEACWYILERLPHRILRLCRSTLWYSYSSYD